MSPVINEPNARIEKDFWRDGDIEKLPYSRGFVFAIYLNNLIKHSNSGSSLDNLMLDMFAATKQQDFSVQLFKNIARNYIATGIESEISRFIEKGETISLEDVMAALPLEIQAMDIYDLGFDEKAKTLSRILILRATLIRRS